MACRWNPLALPAPRQASWPRRLASWVSLGLGLCCTATASGAPPAQASAQPAAITVVLDDNYPPFVFRDAQGQLQGILKDTWELWQQRTGTTVHLLAMDWAKAQQAMQQGQADVIDTIFETDARRQLYDFTAPYAKLDVPIFFHESISGIVNADSLKGFTVGVKDGDACIEVLQGHGVESMKKYPSYTAVIAAAMAGDVRVFCMDRPPALYLLHQFNAEKDFRQSLPLYAGEFHRAVRKGNTALLKQVEDGFARITEAERRRIDEKWYGSTLNGPVSPPYARYVGDALVGVLLVTTILIAWSLMLRARVAARTAELSKSLTALHAVKQSTEQALARLDATLEAIPDLLFEVDIEGKYLDYRAARSDLLAASPDLFLGRTVRDVLPKEAADIVMDALRDASRAGSSQGAQLRLDLPQGEHWFELSIARKRAGPAEVERFIVLSRDITDRRRAQTALLQNEQRLRALLDNISCGAIVHGPDTRIIDANPAACRVVGLTLDQMRGKVAIDPSWCFLEEDGTVMPLARYPVQQVLASGSAINKFVMGVRRPDLPKPAWVHVDAYPLRDDRGQISQIVVTFADITDLKLADDRTRRLNRSLRVLSSCNLGLIEVRDEGAYLAQVCEAVAAAGGYLLACVIFANRDPAKSARVVASAGPATGYLEQIKLSWGADEPAGRGPFGITVRTGLTQVNQDWRSNPKMAPWRDAAVGHGFQSSVALPLTAAGEVIGILSLYAAEVDAFTAEELPPLVELARILSAAIDTLRTRRQRDLAEGASRAKSAFLANMSHEIRTPLNAIVGLNDLMRLDGVTPEQAARLDKIDGASRHLLALIDDILDLSKIEAGQVRLESTDFSLSAVLDSVVSIIAESARAKGLKVEVDAGAVPPWLRGDPTRLRQALLNFAGNAVKFTEQGSIALRARLLEGRDDGLLVRFSVEDTGLGIAPESIPRLFQAFEQADASITRKFGGTGLGLAITRRLAELMGGTCGVESRPGVGSTFWFTAQLQRALGRLPVTDTGAEADADAGSLLQQRHRGARILLAEDNPVNQEVLLSLLHHVGLDADVAADGQAAVEMATAGDYRLVLMDMQMPVIGGLEATRRIRAVPRCDGVPIVALTANVFDEDRQACRASGMDDYLSKPVKIKILYATMLRWLESGRHVQESHGGPRPESGRS